MVRNHLRNDLFLARGPRDVHAIYISRLAMDAAAAG